MSKSLLSKLNLFKHDECNDTIADLTQKEALLTREVDSFKKEIYRLMTEVQESKAMYDYQTGELEKKIDGHDKVLLVKDRTIEDLHSKLRAEQSGGENKNWKKMFEDLLTEHHNTLQMMPTEPCTSLIHSDNSDTSFDVVAEIKDQFYKCILRIEGEVARWKAKHEEVCADLDTLTKEHHKLSSNYKPEKRSDPKYPGFTKANEEVSKHSPRHQPNDGETCYDLAEALKAQAKVKVQTPAENIKGAKRRLGRPKGSLGKRRREAKPEQEYWKNGDMSVFRVVPKKPCN